MLKVVPILPLPEWLDPELWDDFIEYRKEIKKPIGDIGKKRMLKRLKRFVDEGGHLETMIENSINSGKWSNIYFAKEEDLSGANTGFNKKETSADIFAADAESIRNGKGGIW